MPVSTEAPGKIRWQGVVPGRGSDPKLVKSEEVESGGWPHQRRNCGGAASP